MAPSTFSKTADARAAAGCGAAGTAASWRWSRRGAMSVTRAERGAARAETWTLDRPDGQLAFDVRVRTGKPVDVRGLKGADPEADAESHAGVRAAAARLYGTGAAMERLATCPACTGPIDADDVVMRVHDTPYAQCEACGHVAVAWRVSAAIHEALYRESTAHATPYISTEAVESRIRAVAEPKLGWVRDVFEHAVGRRCERVLDVGAGGGHFVAACRRAGLTASGIEIGADVRRFAAEALSIDLHDVHYDRPGATRVLADPDAITMWGLLDYVGDPAPFLRAAHRDLVDRSGLVVVEVPRFDCMSTAVQSVWNDGVMRHQEPTSQVNCFTDASIATLLVRTGFRPVAAWYFGLDMYELFSQQARHGGGPNAWASGLEVMAETQAACDAALMCEGMIVAAVADAALVDGAAGGQ